MGSGTPNGRCNRWRPRVVADLMDLTAKEFEHFIQNRFDRLGFDTKLFQTSGDGGIDCIAYDPAPIRGGKYASRSSSAARPFHCAEGALLRDLGGAGGVGTVQHCYRVCLDRSQCQAHVRSSHRVCALPGLPGV
jgi:hypothetical protein